MKNLNRHLSTKTQNVQVYLNPSRAFIIVALYDAGQFEPKAEFRLANSAQHNAKLASYKTLNAIVKYAVAHQISDVLKELIAEQSQEQDCSNALEGEPSEQLLPSGNCGSPSALYGAVSSLTTSPTLHEPLLFVETATTGLNSYDEICAICVLDANERVIYETLVKPSVPISRGATAYHDITNETVANAPTYDKIHKRLKKIFGKSTLIFYNAEFDTQRIAQTASIAFDAEHLTFRDCFPRNKVFCLMQGYAYVWGDYTYHDLDPAWQPLIRACEQQSIYLDDLPITDKSPIANAKRASRLFAKCFKSDLLF